MWGFVSVLNVFVYDNYSKIKFLQKGGFPQNTSYLNVKMTLDNNLVISVW